MNLHREILTSNPELLEAYRNNPWFKNAFDVYVSGTPHYLQAMLAGAEKCQSDHELAVKLLSTTSPTLFHQFFKELDK